MDIKVEKLTEYLIDYQLKISDSIDPNIIAELKKAKFDGIELSVKKYDQSTVDAIDRNIKFLDSFEKLIDRVIEYGWEKLYVVIDDIKNNLDEYRQTIEKNITELLSLFTYDSDIYLTGDLFSEINTRILTHAFTLKNTELNKKARLLIEKIKVQLLSDSDITVKGYNYDTYSLRIIRTSPILSRLFEPSSDLDDPEKVAKMLKIRLIITEYNDSIIYKDDTIIRSTPFPEFLGVNKALIEENQTTIQFTKTQPKAKKYREIIGNTGQYYYVVRYPDFWALCGKYSDNLPESIISTFNRVNPKILGYGDIYNSEFLRLSGVDLTQIDSRVDTHDQRDFRPLGGIIQQFTEIINEETNKLTFDRVKKIIEKKLILAIRDNLHTDLDQTEVAITFKYTFGNLVNDVISYVSDLWPDTKNVENSYSPAEYKRYMVPKIIDVLHKALEKIFNKSNNVYEILKAKEKIYVKDLQK